MNDLKKWLAPALRRISYRFPARTEAKKAARVARNQYRCAHCGGTFKNSEIQLDHLAPVIDPETGFTDWNSYIARLFPPIDGWQVLCRQCHLSKTNKENEKRRAA